MRFCRCFQFGGYDNTLLVEIRTCRLTPYYLKYVVSMDEFDMSQNGIKHQNIREFLIGRLELGA